MDSILARLPEEPGQDLSWCLNSAASPLQQGSLEDLSTQVMGKTLIALLPGTQVLLLQAQLPKSNRQRLLQAAPYAIEEQLSDKLENLHCAIGPQNADGQVVIAVVARSLIEAWFEAFKNFPAQHIILIPDYLALPHPTETSAFGLVEKNMAAIRLGENRGFSIEADSLDVILQHQLLEAGGPLNLHLFRFDEAALPPLPGHPLEVTSEKCSGELLHFYASHLTIPSINLLQGPYALANKQTSTRRYRIITAAIAASALLMLSAGQMIQYQWLKGSNQLLTQKIASLYREAFPNAQEVTSPRQRLETEMASLQQGSTKNHFLHLLHSAGLSMKETPNAKLVGVDYHDKQLHLQLEVGSFNELDQISKRITTYGIQVKRDNASKTGATVKAQLILARSA